MDRRLLFTDPPLVRRTPHRHRAQRRVEPKPLVLLSYEIEDEAGRLSLVKAEPSAELLKK